MEQSKTTGIVLINYFNDEEVISFITKLLLQTAKDFQIYVMNNGSKDGSLKSFCNSEPRVRFEDAGKNLGYIGGFLHVVKSIKDQMPELLILSNTDIEIENTLIDRISNLQLQGDEVMLGPSIISSRTGKPQNPFYEERISTTRLKILNVAFSNYITYSLYQLLGILKAIGMGQRKSNDGKRRYVYAIHGSFMIFKSSFLEKYFSELADAPFLFGEEIQFAEVALKYGLMTVYDPSMTVQHHEHATTKLFKSGKNLMLLHDSITFMLKKRKEEGA